MQWHIYIVYLFFKGEDLKRDAQEALDIIKTVVGVTDFSTHYALVQSALLKKKIKRKREKAQEVSVTFLNLRLKMGHSMIHPRVIGCRALTNLRYLFFFPRQ